MSTDRDPYNLELEQVETQLRNLLEDATPNDILETIKDVFRHALAFDNDETITVKWLVHRGRDRTIWQTLTFAKIALESLKKHMGIP